MQRNFYSLKIRQGTLLGSFNLKTGNRNQGKELYQCKIEHLLHGLNIIYFKALDKTGIYFVYVLFVLCAHNNFL